MYPAPHFTSLLSFQATKELPFYWQQHLLFESEYMLYSASTCTILIQELQIGNRMLWYLMLNVTEDDQLIKLVLPPQLPKLLLYNIQNTGEIMFLHQDMGLGIGEKDYCYLVGGFSERDLRVLVSKGTYQTVMFPFFDENKNAAITAIRSDETLAFVEKYLAAMGIPLVN